MFRCLLELLGITDEASFSGDQGTLAAPVGQVSREAQGLQDRQVRHRIYSSEYLSHAI